jgi:hypothetical protein
MGNAENARSVTREVIARYRAGDLTLERATLQVSFLNRVMGRMLAEEEANITPRAA